jgi:hypothetical protein
MRTDPCTLLLISAIGIGMLAPEVHADVFIKQQHHTEGFEMMGRSQPSRDLVQKMWLSADKARSDMENHSVIVRLDKRVSYFLDHSRRTYSELPMDLSQSDRSRSDGRSSPEDRATRNPMGRSMPRLSLKITETGETRKIGQYHCRKYIQRVESVMGPVTSEIWTTEDLKMDMELYARFSLALMTFQPGGRETMKANLAETRKMRGVPVLSLTTTRIGEAEVKSRVDLVEFREEQAPPGIFEIPADYRRQAMGSPEPERGAGGASPPRHRQ